MSTPISPALDGKRLVVVDVEGNGQQPPEIIEIAALPVDEGLAAEAMWSWLICPKQKITPFVTRKVHGIRNADVADCPPWPEVAPEIEDLFTDRTLVAHNATVELRVLAAHLPKWTPPMVLDTLRLAKHMWPGLGGYGLDELAGAQTWTRARCLGSGATAPPTTRGARGKCYAFSSSTATWTGPAWSKQRLYRAISRMTNIREGCGKGPQRRPER